MTLTLSDAQALVAGTLRQARQTGLKPMVVVVLDARGTVKASAAEDGTSLKRFEIAHGKAHGRWRWAWGRGPSPSGRMSRLFSSRP